MKMKDICEAWQYDRNGMALQLLRNCSPVQKKSFGRQAAQQLPLDTTEPLTRAMRFYEKQGFGLRGELPNFSACGSWNIGSILPSDSECLAQSHFWQVSTHSHIFNAFCYRNLPSARVAAWTKNGGQVSSPLIENGDLH
jgi:hypothetical protein